MKRLILLGGGHAQLSVLTSLAASPIKGWDVRLITPYRRLIYSGMLPGWIAGHYSLEACTLPLDALSERAGAALHLTAAIALDLARNEIRCADGSLVPFDLLSIDTGPEPALGSLPGAAEHALTVRPIERFVAAWPPLLERMLARQGTCHVVVVGAGAAGVEVALAIQHRCLGVNGPAVRISLVGDSLLPMSDAPTRVRQGTVRMLRERGIVWLESRYASRVTATHLEFPDGTALQFDTCLLITGAAAARWPSESGLAVDERGFIRVRPTLQSLAHPHVFAAGDAAAYHDTRPKSGVYAVRAGPVLAQNLRAACNGTPLRTWTPQRRALHLISMGRKYALASWGRWSLGGHWVWQWKDLIDRRFVRQFNSRRS
ncbi:MAG: FAD-dependent oxidoreductase [Casimicrobiaceae bacterium]